jgi:hypothetical protein
MVVEPTAVIFKLQAWATQDYVTGTAPASGLILWVSWDFRVSSRQFGSCSGLFQRLPASVLRTGTEANNRHKDNSGGNNETLFGIRNRDMSADRRRSG